MRGGVHGTGDSVTDGWCLSDRNSAPRIESSTCARYLLAQRDTNVIS